jgi:hypothetical protein
MRRGILLHAAIVTSLAAAPAAAWNGVGHMTVAKIAHDDLDAATRKQVDAILRRHPHYARYLTKNQLGQVSPEEWAFVRAATWPDYVRGPMKPEVPDPAVVRYHRPDDHFTNFPVFARDASPEFMKKIQAVPARHDVVCALRQRVAELELRTVADDDRAVAQCWLLHLAGDVHQPLHCGTLYIEDRFPRGDFGGNAIGFRFGENKVPERLHTFWDGLLGVTTGKEIGEIEDSPKYTEEAYRLASLKAAAVIKAYPRADLKELTTGRDFKDWADESFELAGKVAYADGKIAEIAVAVPPFPQPVPPTVPEEPAGYSAKAQVVADRRAALAGYRLADLIRRTVAKH